MMLEDNPWLQEWIPSAFITDGGLGTMPWIDYGAIWENHQFAVDAIKQLGTT